MTEHKIPCDTVWLDIEYSDEKRYFTWDKKHFKTPREMLNKIVKDGRKLVTIIDPHVKFDEEYFVYKEANRRGNLVMNNQKKPYHGKCWPQTSSWIDFMNPETLEFKKLLYASSEDDVANSPIANWLGYDAKDYLWHSKDVGVWIDMNEPACFEKTDKTMPKSNLHKILLNDGET